MEKQVLKVLKKRLEAAGVCLLLMAGMLLTPVKAGAEALLGTPKQEALLQLAQECLEKYNFNGIHMNLDVEQKEKDIQIAAEDGMGEDIPEADKAETHTEAVQDYEPLFVPEQYIMVGDSRFVGMEEAVGGGGCVWISQLSAGLSWFADTAVPEIDAAVTDKTAIIINMGINDLGNVMGYIDVLNQKVPEWLDKGAVVYYMSVNPVERHATITNNDIVDFNNTMYNYMPQEVGWIETNAYLLDNGFATMDGLHFDTGTYQTIFSYCMEVLADFSE